MDLWSSIQLAGKWLSYSLRWLKRNRSRSTVSVHLGSVPSFKILNNYKQRKRYVVLSFVEWINSDMKSYKLVTDCYFPVCIFEQFWISLLKWLSVLPNCCLNCAVRSVHFVIGQRLLLEVVAMFKVAITLDGMVHLHSSRTTRPETLIFFLSFVG